MILHILHRKDIDIIDVDIATGLDHAIELSKKFSQPIGGFNLNSYYVSYYDYNYGDMCISYVVDIGKCDMGYIKDKINNSVYRVILKFKRNYLIDNILK